MDNLLRNLDRMKKLPLVGKLSLGMMMGVALGYVLWQRTQTPPRPEKVPGANGSRFPAPPLAEIDITEPRLEVPLAAELASEPRAAASASELAPQTASTATPAQSAAPAAEDDLTRLHGIGPVFARRLNAAGITTFALLAAADPHRLLEITGAKPWQAIDPQTWIDEARSLI